MSDIPAGWYPDPNEPTRQRYWDGTAWSAQTQTPPGAPRSNTGLWLGLGIGGGLLVLAMVAGAAFLLNSGATPLASPTPTATETTANPDVVLDAEVPSDWVPYTNETGTVTFSIGPDWTDWSELLAAEFEEQPAVPGAAIELGGSWLLDGSVLNGGTNAVVIVASDGKPVRSLELQMQGFIIGARAETDEFESVGSSSFVTAQGYKGVREDVVGTAYGEPFEMTVIAVAHEETMVFIQVTGVSSESGHAEAATAMAQSLVINFAPEITN